MSRIQTLSSGNYKSIYQLLKQSKFPDTPGSYGEAEPKFRKASHLGCINKGELLLWVGLFCDNNHYCVDIACKPSWQKHWASRTIIQELFTLLFSMTKQSPLYTIPRTTESLKLCRKLGFIKNNNFYVLESIRQVPILN